MPLVVNPWKAGELALSGLVLSKEIHPATDADPADRGAEVELGTAEAKLSAPGRCHSGQIARPGSLSTRSNRRRFARSAGQANHGFRDPVARKGRGGTLISATTMLPRSVLRVLIPFSRYSTPSSASSLRVSLSMLLRFERHDAWSASMVAKASLRPSAPCWANFVSRSISELSSLCIPSSGSRKASHFAKALYSPSFTLFRISSSNCIRQEIDASSMFFWSARFPDVYRNVATMAATNA